MLPLVLLALVGLACSWRGTRPRVGAHLLALAWSVWLVMRGSGPTALAVVLIVIASGIAVGWSDRAARPREWRAALAVAGAGLLAQASLAARPIVVPAPIPALIGLETLASDLERIAVARGREASELPVVVVERSRRIRRSAGRCATCAASVSTPCARRATPAAARARRAGRRDRTLRRLDTSVRRTGRREGP